MNIWKFIQRLFFENPGEVFGAALGIGITIIVSSFWWLRKIFCDWCRYRKYSGDYISYLKNEPEEEHYHLKLIQHGNKFKVSGNSCHGAKDHINGEIEMSSSIKNFGKGYYQHKTDGNTYKFGFYEIQLAEKDIYVHQDIKGLRKDYKGEDISTAYVWKKQSS